jgi:hypothetical protein
MSSTSASPGRAQSSAISAASTSDGQIGTVASAQVAFVFLHHAQVGAEFSRNEGEFLDVGVEPVTGVAEQHADTPVRCPQLPCHAQHAAQAVRIVGVIEDDLRAADVEAHESPGVVGGVATEPRKHLRDGRRRHAEFRRDECSAGEILDVVAGSSIDRQRHVTDVAQVVLATACR